jgi:hypothetical protein
MEDKVLRTWVLNRPKMLAALKSLGAAEGAGTTQHVLYNKHFEDGADLYARATEMKSL